MTPLPGAAPAVRESVEEAAPEEGEAGGRGPLLRVRPERARGGDEEVHLALPLCDELIWSHTRMQSEWTAGKAENGSR